MLIHHKIAKDTLEYIFSLFLLSIVEKNIILFDRMRPSLKTNSKFILWGENNRTSIKLYM